MKHIQNLLKMISVSGINVETKKCSLFFLKHSSISKLLRIKFSPLSLLNFKDQPELFSKVLSLISIGPAFKSTEYKRHFESDNRIISLLDKSETISIADIGVSDGSSFVDIWEKIKKIKDIQYCLFDKFNFMDFEKKWFGYIFTNTEKKIVYINFLFLLLFAYPFKISHKNKEGKKRIYFINPILKENNIQIKYFDIFQTKLNLKFNIIKCANLLTTRYFSVNEIIDGMRNLHFHLSEKGLLLLIHNEKLCEKFLVLEKNSKKFKLIENYNYDEYLNFLKEKCDFLYE